MLLLRHPNAVPLPATRPVDVDTGLALVAPVLDRSRATGIGRDDAVAAVQSVIAFVLGHALAQAVTGGVAPGGRGSARYGTPGPRTVRGRGSPRR